MISPHVEYFLTEHLQGHRSADDTRQILRLIDDGVYTGEALLAEFDSVLSKVAKKIPGLAIDFDKLLSDDPIECDPLVSQGNLALLRLDAIYYQAFNAWTKSGGDLHRFKRITKAENPATYSDKTEKHERTDQNYPPDAQLLNQVTNIVLAGFRVQATITHRREHLENPNANAKPVSRDATRSESQSQPDAVARDEAQSERPSTIDSDIIGSSEVLDDDLTLKPFPLFGAIQGFRRLDKFNPIVEPSSPTPLSAPSAPPRETYSENTSNKAPTAKEEEPATKDTTNKVSLPIPLSAASASPRETLFFKPLYHKRE